MSLYFKAFISDSKVNDMYFLVVQNSFINYYQNTGIVHCGLFSVQMVQLSRFSAVFEFLPENCDAAVQYDI